MTSKHTIGGRVLATIAGVAAAGASIYMICEDAIKSGQWTRDDIMMPIIIGITIGVGHLIGCASRERKFVSAAVFAGVFALGTGLVVYTSVGRQSRVTETAEAKAEAIAQERARVSAERVRLTKLRNDAQEMLDEEQAKYNEQCEDKKKAKVANCKAIKTSIDMYTGVMQMALPSCRRKPRGKSRSSMRGQTGWHRQSRSLPVTRRKRGRS
jgi:hypothetical protein